MVDGLLEKFIIVSELVMVSYIISSVLRANSIVKKDTLVRRVQKLGDYFGAARSIAGAFKDPTIRKLRNTTSFTEVSLSSLTWHFQIGRTHRRFSLPRR